jgi:hypothetical protein
MDWTNTPDWDSYYTEEDTMRPTADPWFDPASVDNPSPKRGWSTPLKIVVGLCVAAVALVIAGAVVAANGRRPVDVPGTLSGQPADVYRMSATPDYLSFEHVYSAETNADPIVAGTPFAVSLASTFVNVVCVKLQTGTTPDDLVTRLTGVDGLSQNGAQTIVDAAHNLVCTGH